ncbi:Protein FAR1-RELATED SEQUENCE 4 [Linum perenne]
MDPREISSNGASELRDDMEFDSHEDAYLIYKEYAKSVGFGTAKLSSRRSRASKEFIDAKFSCIRYGNKQQSDDAINPRPSPKIGCKASMHVKRRQTGKWYIHSFVKEHNHELLPEQAHFFRSHRNPDPLNNDARVRKKKNVGMSSSNLFCSYQNVGCLDGYMRSQHDKGRSLVLEAGDAQLLLEFCTRMQEENPKFYYAVDLNEQNQLRNLFWVDTKGIEDFNNFGDVVCIDTRYFTNKYRIPLVLFVGVNHHIQPTLFGCALIADETVYTYVWLLQTWSVAMGDRGPRVMLTDQSNGIKTAVAAVFPRTRHCFCLWYILEKVPRQLEYLSLWNDVFSLKFNKCIFKSWTEEEFEKRWWKLIDKFQLKEVEWIQSLYADRRCWVPIFLRDVSFASLSAYSRAESLNSSFDKYVQGDTSVKEFVERYKTILEDMYEEEAKADFDAWHEVPELKSPSPFEKQMHLIYTHEIFKKFQVEVLGVAACHLKIEAEDETTTTYDVKDFEDTQSYVVERNASGSEIYCSCCSFELKGYLCRHAIVVLQMSGIFSIPPKYVLQRWTNAARSRHPISETLDETQAKIRRFNDLCRRAIILGEEGSLSQESYDLAFSAIKEALKQCGTVNNSVENIAVPNLVAGTEKENQCSIASVDDRESNPQLNMVISNKMPRLSETGKGKEIVVHDALQKGKPGDTSAGTQDGFNIVDMSDLGPAESQTMVPTFFHSIAPAPFHSVAHLHQARLHR